MRLSLALGFTLALIAGPVLGCSLPKSFANDPAAVVKLTNDLRKQKRRKLLRISVNLTQAAQEHACYMARSGKLTHTGAGNSDIGKRISATGYRFRTAAENIAEGQMFADAVVAAWANSPGHRKNMLHKKVTEIGIGIAERNGRPFWVMVLAADR